MSWQHWVLVASYIVSVIAAFRDDTWGSRGEAGVFGGLIGIMLLVWGQ